MSWPTNIWSLTQTVAPTAEPVSVQSVVKQARIDGTDDLDTVYLQAKAARIWCETYLQKQLMPATYRLTIDRFPSWTLKLPMPPITAISSITYLDTNGVTQTLSSSLYVVDTYSVPGRVTPAYSQVWPVTRIQINGVNITYTAGYADASHVPDTIKHAIRLIAAHFYQNREETQEAKLQNIPMGATSLLDSERCVDFSGPLGSSNNVPGAVTAWGGNNWAY